MKFLGKFGGTLAGTVHLGGDTPWEMHPGGDECLYLLSGAADLIVKNLPRRWVTKLSAGSACVVPRGRWHRLIVRDAGVLLFITPALGTQHGGFEATSREAGERRAGSTSSSASRPRTGRKTRSRR